MKRKIDINKVYSFIGQTVVYGTIYFVFIGLLVYGLINATTLN